MGLLKSGGYDVAQRLYKYAEARRLKKDIDSFGATGFLPLPQKAIFELTLRCNLKCRMCWQDRTDLSEERELTLAEAAWLFNRASALKTITLIGGEIFLRPDLMDLLSFLNRSRDMVLCTNGTLISGDTLTRLNPIDRIFTFCISLDGNRLLHDDIRGVCGTFDRAVAAIGALAPSFPVTVNCVIQSRNLQWLPDLVTECVALGVKKLKLELERLYTVEKSAETAAMLGIDTEILPHSPEGRDRAYSVDALRSVLEECRQRARAGGLYLAFDPPFLMDYPEACYYDRLRAEKRCTCSRFQTATVAPNGDLLFCVMIRKPIGNLLQTELKELWNSETMSSLRRRIIRENMSPVCENCPGLLPLNE